MHPVRRPLALAVAVALLALPALAYQSGKSQPAAPASMPAMPGMASDQSESPGTSNAADRAMMAGMTKMNQAMSGAPMTGDPDRDFVTMMMPHHQGAIDMARIELQYGKDPTLRQMAKDIVTAQENEMADMRRWQATHHSP
jgi:uncharacterized protein (DUF305 family)